MSRLLRPLTFALATLSLALAGCHTSTPYTRMYSPRKSYYAAPAPKAEKSAEELLAATETLKSSTAPAADPLAPPPAPPAN